MEDFVIHTYKRVFTHDVPMIISPTSYLGVEFFYQIGGRGTQRGLDCSADTIQEGLNILLGGLDEQFSIRLPAHVLSEKIKTFLHVRDDCLCRREFKPSFLQELLDEGLDLTFQ
jgi:hypothetical protein